MTTLGGPAPGSLVSTRAVTSGREVLRRADGVQLIGEMAGSGYRVPPALVRRADGQTLQLTPLLYLTLEAVDGQRTVDQVATSVSTRSGRRVTPDNVRAFVESQLRPRGLLATADGRQPEVRRSDPLLGLRLRWAITDPARTRRLTGPFTILFRPMAVLPLLAAFAAVCWWVFFEKGLASAAYDAFEHPGLLLFVFAVTVLSAGFHEFGHAAAARYGGATPGSMGAGLYLIWPAFYTDVTDSYRLGRAGRVRTDLGGLYFNAVISVAITAAWWLTGYDALLLVVATQVLQMLRQLTPLVRFDGYHILADLTGVPDLFHRIRPTLLGCLPWRWHDHEARLLKPWARVVVTLWVALVVPALLFTVGLLVLTVPRILATAWARLGEDQSALARAWEAGAVTEVAARSLTMVAVVLPFVAGLYLAARVLHRLSRWAWRASRGSLARRSLAFTTAVAVVAGLAWAWWPDDQRYRPIRPDEKGTLVDVFARAGTTSRPATTSVLDTGSKSSSNANSNGTHTALWDTGSPLPTRGSPQLSLVLIPQAGGSTPSTGGAVDPAWVFPFDEPLAPGPGDNQALALNTGNGTVVYDVAIALVWVEDGAAAMNTNEAYAFASCARCAAVSVAFQVVLVVGESDAIVPRNLAGALNHNCVNCLTYALAQQLLVTIDGPLSDASRAELDAVWQQVADFADAIESVPLSEIDDRLDTFAGQILGIIEADQPGTVPSEPTSTSTSAESPSTPTGSPTTTGSSPSTPSGSHTPTESASPTQSPEPTPTSTEPSPAPSPAPSSAPTP